MTMTSIRKAYERVNATWPKEVPPMTAGEAIRAASRLYRWALGTTFVGTIQETSGNRVNGIRWRGDGYGTASRERVLYVNPEQGWKTFVHHLSHDFYWAANGFSDRPHNKDHARVERNMIKEVLKRGWLDGRLKDEPKPEPTKDDLRLDKLARIDANIQMMDRKALRIMAALKRLHASRKALLRVIDNPPKPRPPREKQLTLLQRAQAAGIKVEKHTDLDSSPWWVSSDRLEGDADPFDGDHYTHTISERNEMIRKYLVALGKELP